MKNGRNPWEMIATVKARRRAFFRIIRGYNIMAIMAAGINFGKPNTEFIVESDENGVAQSCRNVDTGVEYVGGGSSDFSTAEVPVKFTFPDPGEDTQIENYIPIPYISNNRLKQSYTETTTIHNGSTTYSLQFKVPLYKGKAECKQFLNYLNRPNWAGMIDHIDVFQNCTYDQDNDVIVITGDSVINIYFGE